MVNASWLSDGSVHPLAADAPLTEASHPGGGACSTARQGCTGEERRRASKDRRLRLPLRLPHGGPGRLQRLHRLVVPVPLRRSIGVGRLLDPDAGHWALQPAGDFESKRRYVGATLVLRTTFVTADGEVDVTDALALEPGARGHDIGRRSPHTLLRRVEGRRGTVAMTTEVAPRMEYGLTSPHWSDGGDGLVARGGPVTLSLHSGVAFHPPRPHGQGHLHGDRRGDGRAAPGRHRLLRRR